MSTASDPACVPADVYAEDVAGVGAEGFGQGPVISGEDVNVFIEAGGNEKGA